MSYLYAILVIIPVVLLFVICYCLNSEIEVECENKELCDVCKISECIHRNKKEEE